MRKRRGRNPDGMGSLETLPSKKVRYVLREKNLKRTGPAVEPGATYKESLGKARAAFDLKFNPPQAESKKPTLAKFLQGRLDGDLKDELAPRTHDLYQRIFDNHIVKNPIGKVPLDQVTDSHVDDWKAYLKACMSDTSVQRYLQFLATQLRWAKRKKIIKENPFDAVDMPSREDVNKRVLNKSELAAFVKLPWHPKAKIAVHLMRHGLRKSEACGVRYEDFDGEGITVQRQAIEVAGELQVLPLKTANSYRWVPCDDDLKKILRKKKEGWVLEGAKGKPLRGRTLHKWWAETVKGTPYADVTPHDLRSSFGMLLLEAGADVRTAAEILGHSPAVLARIYARSRKEVKVDALAKIAALPTKRARVRKEA